MFFKGHKRQPCSSRKSGLLGCILLPLICFAQQKQIDSLKTLLPARADTAQVDCLNNISNQYILTDEKDSAVRYADLALVGAKNCNYSRGIALAYSCQSQIAKHFDDDFIGAEKLGRQALGWYQTASDKKGLVDLYEELAIIMFAQSRFSESLKLLSQGYQLVKESRDNQRMSQILSLIGSVHKESGEYDKAFGCQQKLFQLESENHQSRMLSAPLFSIGELYMKIEDFQSALNYFRSALEVDNDEARSARKKSGWDIWTKMEFAEIYGHLGLYDSANHYYKIYKPVKGFEKNYRIYQMSIGEYYLTQKKYANALDNFLSALIENKRINDRNQIMRALMDIGKTYLCLEENLQALKYGREGLAIALQTKAKQFIRDGYQVLSTVFDRLHQTDSANFYFRKHIAAKDEVLNDQAKGRFVAYNYEQQIAAINDEKKLQQAALQNEALLRKGLLAGGVLLTLLGALIIRNILLGRKHEKQKLQHELQLQKLAWQQQTTELEMQALRAQMNPHFIFNSLNAINRFILQSNKAQASEYLTKFSRLVRLILQNSQTALIPLESELEALHLYLELEALRFDHQFEYSITVDKELDADMIKVPPLIIQPYAENAIWHGLMHKEEKGHLRIEISEEENTLLCRISDDGVGRKKAAEMKNKSAPLHKSMGLRISAERIALLQRSSEQKEVVAVKDLTLPDGSPGGTEVTLKISLRYA